MSHCLSYWKATQIYRKKKKKPQAGYFSLLESADLLHPHLFVCAALSRLRSYPDPLAIPPLHNLARVFPITHAYGCAITCINSIERACVYKWVPGMEYACVDLSAAPSCSPLLISQVYISTPSLSLSHTHTHTHTHTHATFRVLHSSSLSWFTPLIIIPLRFSRLMACCVLHLAQIILIVSKQHDQSQHMHLHRSLITHTCTHTHTQTAPSLFCIMFRPHMNSRMFVERTKACFSL